MTFRIDIEFEDGGLFGRLDDQVIVFVNKKLEGVMKETSEAIIGVMRTYPPQKEMRRPYARSERLQSGWKYNIENLSPVGQQAHIFNHVPYSGYLHDNERQVAWARRRGWPTAQNVVLTVAGVAVAAQDHPDYDPIEAVEIIAEELANFIESGQSGAI